MILQTLHSNGYATVATLSSRLEASPATIRRDLLKLEEVGLLSRVFGGAVVEQDQLAVDEAAEVRGIEKDTIAAQAATMIEDGQSIILDSGTTVHRLAHHLRGRRLTVITNSLMVYEELAQEKNIDLMLLGGMVIRESRMLDGFITGDNLRHVHADQLFMGACGVRSNGQVMDSTIGEVPARRAMIIASDRVVLLADRSKFPGTGMVKICGPEELDLMVTNAPLDGTTYTALAEAGVTVLEAPPATGGN